MTNKATYYNTVDSDTGRRLPAEWEADTAVMLSWPHADTDWAYMLEDVYKCYVELAEALSRYHTLLVVAPDIAIPRAQLQHLADRPILFCQVATNDTWIRDYGPITLTLADGSHVAVDYCFNGWGLKFAADKDNLVTSKLIHARALTCQRDNRLGFVLEGGSIESDGCGTLMTTSECLLSPNRNGDLSKMDIERQLRHDLGVDRVLWIDHGYLAGDDTDSHVDTLARFAPDDTILYVGAPDSSDEHHDALMKMEIDLKRFTTINGQPYNLIALPIPDPIYDEDGQRLPATYANFLATDRAVFMPVYGQAANDRLARQMIKIAFPDHDVVTVDCNALIRQHGSLHCATMQIPKEILPI